MHSFVVHRRSSVLTRRSLVNSAGRRCAATADSVALHDRIASLVHSLDDDAATAAAAAAAAAAALSVCRYDAKRSHPSTSYHTHLTYRI